eukprot:Em0012g714a
MNAALQSLGCVAPLRDYLAKGDLNDKGEIVEELSIMMHHMWTESQCFSPCKIKNKISESNARFGQAFQEDSQEFLQALIEKLHQCLKISVSEATILHLDQDSTELEASNTAWHRYLTTHGKSIVSDLFEGQLQSSMTCKECNRVTWKFDPLMFLPVPIPSAMHSEKVHSNLNILEDMSGTAQNVTCKADMERKSSIAKLPNILMIYLKRFQTNFQSGGRCKVHTHVTFPLRDFELSDDLMSESAKSAQLKYTLIAVINHTGDMKGGHYTAYGKRNNEWFSFDDSTVECISEDGIVSRFAYVLFYQKDTTNDDQQLCKMKPQCGSMQLSCNITTNQETVSQCNNTHQIQEETHPSADGEGEGRGQYTGSNLFSRLASCKYYLYRLFCCCRCRKGGEESEEDE